MAYLDTTVHQLLLLRCYLKNYTKYLLNETNLPTPFEQVTEDDLKYTIKNALLEDSMTVFKLLGGVGSVNEELKLQFLQLLCFYNEKEPDSLEWLEERWFSANMRERQAATWR